MTNKSNCKATRAAAGSSPIVSKFTRRAMLDLRRFPTRPTWPAAKALAHFSPGQVYSGEVDKDQAIKLLGSAQKVHARPRV